MHHHEEYPVGKSFLFSSKGWLATTVLNLVICWIECQGRASSLGPWEHLLTEKDGKLTMYWGSSCKAHGEQASGKGSPGQRRYSGKGADGSWRPRAGRGYWLVKNSIKMPDSWFVTSCELYLPKCLSPHTLIGTGAVTRLL